METKLLSRRNGQSAVEFTFLLIFVLFIATLVVVLLQQNLDREIEALDRQIVQEFRNVWYEEIEQARESTGGYSREFEVNSNPRGFPVISRFGDSPNNVTDELVISYKDYEFLFFLPTDVDYSGVGQNVSLSDGVKVSRRCQDQCEIFLYEDTRAPGGKGNALDFLSTGLGSVDFLTGDAPLLFASGQSKFSIVNISDPKKLSVTTNGTSSGGAQFEKVTSADDVAAAPRGAGNKIDLVNISDPQNTNDIATIDSFPGGASPKIMVMDYPYGYVLTDQPGFHVFYLGNWSDPKEIDSLTSPTWAGIDGVYDQRGYVFTAADSANIGVYNVKDRFNVSYETTISSPSTTVKSVALRDDYLYAVQQGEAAIYDVSDVSSVSKVATVNSDVNDGRYGTLWRDYWFIADGSNGYTVLDISDPKAPEKVFSKSFANDVSGIYADHDAVYLAFESNATIASYE